ncbi:MAG: TOMM precursor leader peptide-binding protein, partial [Actinomyces massiliensis]
MAERVDSIDGVKSPESPANPENPAASAASAASGMRAADVGRAARQDLQFRIPRKPVVRLGVRMRPEDETWVLEGGRKRQVLGGAFAREHLGALLQACDGTRTLDQIAEAMGIGPGGAFEAVSLLWTGGIVEEGDTDPLPDPQPAPELACLLSRLGESTGVNDSWQDAARRLAAARVAVLGDAALADDVVSALSPTLAVAARAAAVEPGDTLAVVVETAEAAETGDAGSAINRCWELGVPLLRVRAEHDAVTIGPYIDPSFSPCPQCATAGESDPGPVPGPDRRDLAVGMAARAVAALIARATMIHLPGDIRRIDLETFRHTDHPVTTRPGCPICSITGGSGQADESDGPSAPVAQSAPIGARYEQAVAIPPAGFVDSKGHQQHYKPSNLRLQREFRDWPNCPRTLLPDADLERLNRPWPLGGAGAQAAGSSGTPVSDRT